MTKHEAHTPEPWREVSAKRVRKIRKTYAFHEADIRPCRTTRTGKARYQWRPVYGIWLMKARES